MSRTLFIACLFLLAGPASAQDPVPKSLGELTLHLDKLQSWKTKTYSYRAAPPGSSEKTNVGMITLKTIVEPNCIILDDQIDMTFRGEELMLKLTHFCQRDIFLSPTRIESVGEGSDEVGTFIVTVYARSGAPRRQGANLHATEKYRNSLGLHASGDAAASPKGKRRHLRALDGIRGTQPEN